MDDVDLVSTKTGLWRSQQLTFWIRNGFRNIIQNYPIFFEKKVRMDGYTRQNKIA